MEAKDPLFLKCLAFIREISEGEWTDQIENGDAKKLEAFVRGILSDDPPDLKADQALRENADLRERVLRLERAVSALQGRYQ